MIHRPLKRMYIKYFGSFKCANIIYADLVYRQKAQINKTARAKALLVRRSRSDHQIGAGQRGPDHQKATAKGPTSKKARVKI